MKSLTVLVAVLLVCASAAPAFAQRGGGRRGGGSGGGGGGASSSNNPVFAPLPPSTPTAQVEMVGVVEEVDPQAQRVTIAYEAAPLANLQAFTMPFPVARPDLLTGVAVGQKIRFKVESHQIYSLRPF